MARNTSGSFDGMRPISVSMSKDWKQRMGQAYSPAACRVVRPYFDADERQPSYPGELWSLLVGLSIWGGCYIAVWSLILEKVNEDTNVFRRVGVTEDTVHDMNDRKAFRVPEPLDGEYTTITLV